MGKQYKAEFRAEAVKLSEEIGPKAASERLGVNLDTMYTWISKFAKRTKAVEEIVASKGTDGLVYENEALKKALKEREEEIEILQDALGFFAKRRKK